MPSIIFVPFYYIVNFISKHLEMKLEDRTCFIVSEQNKGWILERYGLELVKYSPGKSTIHYGLKNLPKAKSCYFTHYSLLISALKRNPFLFRSRITVHYTHMLSNVPNKNEVFHVLKNYADVIICMNSSDQSHLEQQGIDARKLHTVIGAFDNKFNRNQLALSKKVLICAAYYERKNPKKLLAVVKAAPDIEFSILGPGWEKSNLHSAFTSLGNVEFLLADFEDYPKIYQKHGVFLSASLVEGGPIPMLEAMAANLKPVCSKTGFSEDVIVHGVNGFLFDHDTPASKIVDYLRSEISQANNLSELVQDYTWENYCKKLNNLMSEPKNSDVHLG